MPCSVDSDGSVHASEGGVRRVALDHDPAFVAPSRPARPEYGEVSGEVITLPRRQRNVDVANDGESTAVPLRLVDAATG